MAKFYSGPVSDHFDGQRFHVPGHSSTNSFSRLLRWQLMERRARWPATFPSPFRDMPPQRVAKDGLRVTLIGHASFLIQIAGINMLVDPVYSRRASPLPMAGPLRVNEPGIGFDDLPPIDLVLVSHSHYDHLDVTTLKRLQQRFKPRFVCPLGCDKIIGPALGGDAHVAAFDWGQHCGASEGVTIHFAPSYHWSARSLADRCTTLWSSFVITSTAATAYHVADTAYGDGVIFRDVARKFGPVDLAILPIGAYEPRWFMQVQHVNPEEAVNVLADCGAAHAIGHHWGTFQLTNEAIDQPESDLAAALHAAGIAPARFRAFRPGQVWQKPRP